MKKLFLILVCVILGSGIASSQNNATDKGAIILGGSANFMSVGADGSSGRSTSLSINPVADFFIIQNLFLGGGLTFGLGSSPTSDNSTIGIGPELGYAFANTNSSMFPFLKIGFSYWSSTSKYAGNTLTYSGTSIIIGGGIVFEIVKHVGLVGLLSYNITDRKYSSSSSQSSNSIEISFGIYGLLY